MSDRAALFHQNRPRLYAIAYRMLGSRPDAEDMVQEAYLRWHRVDVDRVQTPQAWLVTTVTRLCIDHIRETRSERDAYQGSWLPEPVEGPLSPGADAHAELASDLSIAFLVVLERLAPEERAAFLLHDVFDTDYPDIAALLGKSESACRQIVHRARERVRADRPRFKVTEGARRHLLGQFIDALRAQNHAALLALFARNATWTADGGGRVRAALKVVHGRDLVARFAAGVWSRHLTRTTHELRTINGELALVVYSNGRPHVVIAIETDGREILAVYAILNPDKLWGIAPKGDWAPAGPYMARSLQ